MSYLLIPAEDVLRGVINMEMKFQIIRLHQETSQFLYLVSSGAEVSPGLILYNIQTGFSLHCL